MGATPATAWREQYSDGYRTGRGDAQCGQQRMPLVAIPAELPGETGAQYITRNLQSARAIGYTRGYLWVRDHQPA